MPPGAKLIAVGVFSPFFVPLKVLMMAGVLLVFTAVIHFSSLAEPDLDDAGDSAPVRLGDVAKVADSVENRYNSGFYNDEKAVLLVVNDARRGEPFSGRNG